MYITKLQHTEGWECDLGVWGWNSFFANNGLGGFLGPNWKVFHHWTLREHFQGAVIAFGSQPDSEIRVEKGWKINLVFLHLQYPIFFRDMVDEALFDVRMHVPYKEKNLYIHGINTKLSWDGWFCSSGTITTYIFMDVFVLI